MTMTNKVRTAMQTHEEQAFEALCVRVEAAHAWTPLEKARFVRRTSALIHELMAELEWRAAVVSDMHDDVYPQCGRACCADGGGECTMSDRLAEGDSLVSELAMLYCALDGAIDEIAEASGVADDPALGELERRLAKAPRRRSPWVERRRDR